MGPRFCTWYTCVHASLACFGCQALFTGSPFVVNLNPGNFKSTVVDSNRTWVVDFYSGWCFGCIYYASVWEGLAATYTGDHSLSFGAVECTKYTKFCSKLEVDGYPCLRAWHFPRLPRSKTFHGHELPENASGTEAKFEEWLAAHKPDAASPQKASSLREARLPKTSPNLTPRAPVSTSPHVAAQLRLHDALVALLYSFRQGIFLKSRWISVNGSSLSVLSQDALSDFTAFLDFLSHRFPCPKSRRDLGQLLTKVRLSTRTEGHLSYDSWQKTLDAANVNGFPPDAGVNPQKYWRFCRSYTCGLWTLFHIMAMAPKITAPAMMPNGTFLKHVHSTKQTPPTNPIHMIRAFIVDFFGCKACVHHFVSLYDNCTFGGCRIRAGDSEKVALWLWNIHNIVTVHVANERHLPNPRLWPSKNDCPACWVDGQAVERTIYKFLKQSYLPKEHIWQPHRIAAHPKSANLSLVWGVICIVVIFSLCGLCYVCTASKSVDTIDHPIE